MKAELLIVLGIFLMIHLVMMRIIARDKRKRKFDPLTKNVRRKRAHWRHHND